MKKYLIRFGLVGTLTFLVLFIYFYKTSGKFRKSIIAAFAADGRFRKLIGKSNVLNEDSTIERVN